MNEGRARSLIKAISFRVIATTSTFLIVRFVTGSWTAALSVIGIDVFIKFAVYYFHERAWSKITFGLKDKIGCVVWFTGLPCSGKTTMANKLSEKLKKKKIVTETLDGDKVREVLPGKGFSKEARNQNVRHMGFIASMLERNGVIAISSFVSPYKEARDFVRENSKHFVEVHVATPLEECERRDVKGMYKKARAGEIANFTGIDDPYEIPENPELIIDTTSRSIDSCVDEVEKYLKTNNLI